MKIADMIIAVFADQNAAGKTVKKAGSRLRDEHLQGRWHLARPMRRLVLMALALLPVTAAAQAPEIGRALAERWCVSCHLIDRSPRSGAADGVPTFPAIAAEPATTEASLRGVLSQPHARMPDFSLGGRDQDALIAYILSLR